MADTGGRPAPIIKQRADSIGSIRATILALVANVLGPAGSSSMATSDHRLKKAKARRMRRVAGIYATATVRLHSISLATN